MDSPQKLPPKPQQDTLRVLGAAAPHPSNATMIAAARRREVLMISPSNQISISEVVMQSQLDDGICIIFMFHCFHRQTLKVPKRTPGRIIAVLPLHSNHVAVLDESQTITLYKLPSGKVISHLQLPFKPRRWAIGSPQSLIILAAEDRSVYQVLPWEESYKLVVYFQPSHHYNTQQVQMRQREYFSTMALSSFNQNTACYLREERTEERKLCMHFLEKREGAWVHTSHQLPLNGALVEKADERSRVTVWKQQVAVAGQVEFSVLQLQTMQQEEVHLESVLFTLFSIVKAIRAIPEGWLLCLNHKQPQMLFFSTKTNHNQVREQPIHTNLLWIVVNDHSFINFSLSDQDNHSGKIELRRPTGELLDREQSTSEEVIVSRAGEMVVEYDRERKESEWLTLHATRVIQKEKLYLSLMEGWGQQLKNTLSNGFMREVLELLQ